MISKKELLSDKQLGYYQAAHKCCIYNEKSLKSSGICGCFYCLCIYKPDEIEKWLEEANGEYTAFCPYCGIDSVIGDSTGYPIDKEFLEIMYEKWFSTEEKTSFDDFT